MPFHKNPAQIACILCKKRKKRIGSLFCGTCSRKGAFIKINALKKSKEYKQGWLGYPRNYGRLPKRL